MMVYFAAFIYHFADIMRALYKLLKKDAPFIWGDEQEESFLAAKRSLISAPVLAYAQPELPFSLYVDASYENIAGVLQQIQKIQKQ